MKNPDSKTSLVGKDTREREASNILNVWFIFSKFWMTIMGILTEGCAIFPWLEGVEHTECLVHFFLILDDYYW